MSGFIEGEDRHQATLFPESLDEYIAEDSAVRVIDVFIDDLDISGLGFKTEPADTGRPGAFVAIDGSKFKAVNTRDKNCSKAKMKRRLQQIDDSIVRYLGQIESADRVDPGNTDKVDRLQDKIAALKAEMQRLKKLEARMLEAPGQQISLTDPDARSMATSGRGSGVVGYNVQTAVDAKHHLIVAHEVTNIGNDRSQLHNMARPAKEALEVEALEVVADRGYFKGEEILACEQDNITTYLPKPLTSGNVKKGLFSKRDFIYHPEDDEYECPAGERLIYRCTSAEKGQAVHKYWSSACPSCPIKTRCTTGKNRRVSRWEHEHVLEALEQRLDAEPGRMRVRRTTSGDACSRITATTNEKEEKRPAKTALPAAQLV